MLWKCCTQYASTFGKLSSGHRTGKGQFSFQSPKKAVPKNAQTAAQLHSSHTHGSVGKESTCSEGDPSSIPWLGRSAGEGMGYTLQHTWASLVAQLVKNPPAMQETWVQSLGWEDPLEKEKATHSSILAWRIPWTVLSMGSQRVGHNWATFTFIFIFKRWYCESAALNMPANLESSAVATALEKVSFHSNPKERQHQRMLKLLHNCTHLTH